MWGRSGSLVPVANALALPFLFRSVEHLHAVLDGPVGEDILASFEKYGFVGLTFYDSGARSIYNSKRPVYTLADLKGLRIRVQQSELMAEMIRALGAAAGRAALRPGRDRARDRPRRRRREQLAVLRHHRPLQVRAATTR